MLLACVEPIGECEIKQETERDLKTSLILLTSEYALLDQLECVDSRH
jgi:hypothetical protein